MFYYHSATAYVVVVFYLLFCKRSFLTSFVRHIAVGMIVFDALITRINLDIYSRMDMCFAFFEHPEIMLSPFICFHAKDLSVGFTDYYLCFLCMPFLFAGIIPSLFFLGRSTGLSPTSITNTFHCISL